MESNKKRRSSILKPQKSRNPTSEIEVANDNTVTRLLTRRVSFASSNFIKEFAADPERNTIWNVTYEEIVNKSDSTRSSENAQNTLANQKLIQTTPASIHNLEGGLTTELQVSNINEPSKSIPNVSQPSLPENQVAMKSKCQNKTVTEGCALEFTQLCIPNNPSKFNKTSLDESTMDFTGYIDNFKPPLNSTTVKQDQNVKLKDFTLTETSMDITDIQGNNYKIIETKPLDVKNPTEIQDKQSTCKENSLGLTNKDITNENMEVTQNVLCNLLIGQNTLRGTEFNKTVLLEESMEFTQKAPQLQNYKTRSDQSMEFTQMVPTSRMQENRNFPQTLSSIHQNPGIQILNKENALNKTKCLNDSMDFTQKILFNQYNFQSEMARMGQNQQFQPTLLPKSLEGTPSQESTKTKLFNDSMDITESVPLNQCNFNAVQNVKTGLNHPIDSTQSLALRQKKLEVTRNPLNQYNFESENIRMGQSQQFQQTLTQKSLEIAPSQLAKQEGATTKLFNDSMDITESVPLNQCNFDAVQNVNTGLNHPIDSTQSLALRQKKLEVTRIPINQYNFESGNNSSEKKQQFQQTLHQENLLVQREDVKTKLFNDTMEFTLKQCNFEGLQKPNDETQNTSLLQKMLEIAPSQIVQQEDVKTKPFNDSTKFTEKMPVQQYDFEGQENIGKMPNLTSCGTENPALLQKEFQITSSKLVLQEDVKRKFFNNSIELTEKIPLRQISLNFDKPDRVLNTESLQNSCKQDKNSTSEKFIQGSRILENRSKLFESVEIPGEISLNSETYLVQYQQKENAKQIHNWTQTWNDSAQIVQEMSVNRETAIHSMQTLQMSGIKDLIQNVSFPEMCGNITEVTQELSRLDARKVIQKQEEFCNSQFLQEGTTSQKHIDTIPSDNQFWSDSYMTKYEREELLEDEIIPPLHDSLNSIDCSPLHIKKPILSLSKTEIPFRSKLKDFESYLENTSLEMEKINETLEELKGELLSEMTLPQHSTVDYEKVDFEALQNYSFEDDMNLASDDSTVDDSLLHLKFNSNENDEAALTIREKIHNKNSRCKEYCNIIYVENSKCKLDTLFGSIRLEVDFNDETGEVSKIEFCDRLSDKSKPSALLAHKVFRDTLSLKHIRAAVGEHYDILTLMDYIYMNMQKIVDFMSDFDMFEGQFGLKLESNFSVKFNIVSLTLRILWWITVDLSDMENISEDNIIAVAEVGSLKEYNIKTFLNNCPRGIRFLSAFINNILSHIELLETQRKKK